MIFIPNSVQNSSIWFKLIAYPVYYSFGIANKIWGKK